MAMISSPSSVLKANNPLLKTRWKRMFLHASSSPPPFRYPTLTLGINICFATKKLCCCRYHEVFTNSSSSSSIPNKLVFGGSGSNNVVVLPCIKTKSSGSPTTTTCQYQGSSGERKIIDKSIYDYEQVSLKVTTRRYQAIAAMTVLGSLLMLMAYGHLPALAGPSKALHSLRSSSSSSSSPFGDSEEEDDDDLQHHDCEYCHMEALNPSATEDGARNDVSETTCHCKVPAAIRTSWTYTNPGRRFRACTAFPWKGACNFFAWVDPPICPRSRHLNHRLLRRLIEVENEILQQKKVQVRRLLCVLCGTLGVVDVMVDCWDAARERERDVGATKSTGEW